MNAIHPVSQLFRAAKPTRGGVRSNFAWILFPVSGPKFFVLHSDKDQRNKTSLSEGWICCSRRYTILLVTVQVYPPPPSDLQRPIAARGQTVRTARLFNYYYF